MLDSGPDISLRDLRSIYALHQSIDTNIAHLEIQGRKYYIKERELHILDTYDTLYIFDLTESLTDQIEKLSVYFTERGIDTSKEMTYIDMRVPRGIFQCSRENENRCRRNLINLY